MARRIDPDDQSVRWVELTPRGWAGIEAGRAARAAVTAEWRAVMGDPAGEVMATLQRLAVESGGWRLLLDHRLHPWRRPSASAAEPSEGHLG